MYENEFKKQGLLNLRAKTRQKSLKIKFTQPNGKDFKQQNKFCDEGFCCDLIEKTILSKKAFKFTKYIFINLNIFLVYINYNFLYLFLRI